MTGQTNGVYADHPFPLLSTPTSQLPDGTKPTIFHNMASEMVLVHNMVFRGLNSIYLQAPHIKPVDVTSFLNYMYQWHRTLHTHHEGEEALFFPAVERLSGETGIMEVNVNQHRSFGEGLHAFSDYVDGCMAGKQEFNGHKVVELLDMFGPTLTQHLTEEIGTLLALERFGEEKMKDLPGVMAEEAETAMKDCGFFTGLPWVAVNLDRHFENDRWLTEFPPGSGQTALAVVRNVSYWLHRDWWKFGACDRMGNMKPLYAAGDGSLTEHKSFAAAPVVQDLAIKTPGSVSMENKAPVLAVV